MRKQLLDTLRPTIEKEIGEPVRFLVKDLRVSGRFAYYQGEVLDGQGRALNFLRTKLREQVIEGLFDGPRTSAYFERANSGSWLVRAWQIGSTDFPDPGWPEEFGGPLELVIGHR